MRFHDTLFACVIAHAVVSLIVVAQAVGDEARFLVVDVQAGDRERVEVPVSLALPGGWSPDAAYQIERVGLRDISQAAPAQVISGDPARLVWIIRDRLPKNTARRYRISTVAASEKPRQRVTCTDDGKTLLLKVGDKSVLRYHQAIVQPPQGIKAIYAKSAHIHPLWTPSGIATTEDFPPDHAHQHSVFFAWRKAMFKGREMDFWGQQAQQGRVEHASTRATVSGPVFAQFEAIIDHVDPKAPGGDELVLTETMTVRVYDVDRVFLVDIESDQRCAGDSPLKILQFHYGGLAIRGHGQWWDPAYGEAYQKWQSQRKKDPNSAGPEPRKSTAMLTSEGRTEQDGNHTRPNWVDIHGTTNGRPAGITALQHPSNFRFPHPVRLHPFQPYFCFAPMVLGEFEITPEQPYRARYRFVVHDGHVEGKEADQWFADFAEPPKVRIVR